MRKIFSYMVLGLCCLSFAAAYATDDETEPASVATADGTVAGDESSTPDTPSSLFKRTRGGCGCGGGK